MPTPFIHLESTAGERYVKRKSDDLKETDFQEKWLSNLTEKGCWAGEYSPIIYIKTGSGGKVVWKMS